MRSSLGRKYIYCIVSVDGSQSGESLPIGFEVAGINNSPLFPIQFNDIAAIVSEISNEDIQLIRSAIRSGRQEGMGYFVSHQKAVHAFQKEGFTVLPVRFGSIVTDSSLQQLLLQQYASYKTKVIRFKNKDEYGVRLLLGPNTEHLIRKAVEQSPEVRHFQYEAESDTARPGRSYFSNLRLKDLLRSKRFRIIENGVINIHERFASLADSTAMLSRDTPDTIANRAYLVNRFQAQEFIQAIEEAKRMSNPLQLLVHTSGPWAPYSFCMESTSSSDPVSIPKAASKTQRVNRPRYRLIRKSSGSASSF
jgi:Gas vesicle synthesis protein GvpL/GvpF